MYIIEFIDHFFETNKRRLSNPNLSCIAFQKSASQNSLIRKCASFAEDFIILCMKILHIFLRA